VRDLVRNLVTPASRRVPVPSPCGRTGVIRRSGRKNSGSGILVYLPDLARGRREGCGLGTAEDRDIENDDGFRALFQIEWT
jgi:hypothetical protein